MKSISLNNQVYVINTTWNSHIKILSLNYFLIINTTWIRNSQQPISKVHSFMKTSWNKSDRTRTKSPVACKLILKNLRIIKMLLSSNSKIKAAIRPWVRPIRKLPKINLKSHFLKKISTKFWSYKPRMISRHPIACS